jgi:hypothetical protein
MARRAFAFGSSFGHFVPPVFVPITPILSSKDRLTKGQGKIFKKQPQTMKV